MSGLRARGLRRRGIKGIWQHTRRVPVRYSDVETRELIRTSLHTQDYGLALAKAAQIELLQDQEWELALYEAGGLKVLDCLRQAQTLGLIKAKNLTRFNIGSNRSPNCEGFLIFQPMKLQSCLLGRYAGALTK